jgi:hypothetical protein
MISLNIINVMMSISGSIYYTIDNVVFLFYRPMRKTPDQYLNASDSKVESSQDKFATSLSIRMNIVYKRMMSQ